MGAAIAVLGLVYLAIIVLMVASQWTLFQKAGKPGWACIVPIYNIIVMLEIIRKPTWWIAMLFIPVANIVYMIMIHVQFVKAYGKSTGYAVAALFFGIIMFPILAFSKDTRYVLGENENVAASSALDYGV